ncbi:MAG TPA: type III pantothenate kinase [Myxococcota bacterium]|nr:type III pantothenate kinase [Myxococcota bacterium]HQK50666.1 type III pantothenate kinase [Myxococcota bacterium]
MLIAIDVGNTHTVIGAFEGDRLLGTFRLTSHRNLTVDELSWWMEGLLRRRGLDPGDIRGLAVSSVVPPLTGVFEEYARRNGTPLLVVGPSTDTGIAVRYEPPADVGADRVVNAVAAHHRCPDCDVIVVDFGTATTFDAVTARGEYLGGVIVPGVTVSLDALFARTARLPRVEVQRPPAVVGRTTVHSIQSGAYYGYLAMMEGLVTRMRAEMREPVRVLATGGLAGLLAGDSPLIDEVLPDLTLEGLRLVWERQGRPLS